jgi:hypothetical protein
LKTDRCKTPLKMYAKCWAERHGESTLEKPAKKKWASKKMGPEVCGPVGVIRERKSGVRALP